MRLPVTGEIRRYLRSSLPFGSPSFSPQLRSDFRKNRTRTGLPPSPALLAFPDFSTLFVSAFSSFGHICQTSLVYPVFAGFVNLPPLFSWFFLRKCELFWFTLAYQKEMTYTLFDKYYKIVSFYEISDKTPAETLSFSSAATYDTQDYIFWRS